MCMCACACVAKSCPRGMQYSECLPKLQRTCATLYSVASFFGGTEEEECFPGCHCPAGKLLHAGECVKPIECPCQYQKQFYGAGQVVKIDCNYWSVCLSVCLPLYVIIVVAGSFISIYVSSIFVPHCTCA